MIPVETALGLVLEQTQALDSERIPFQGALGRVLAQDVIADMDLPPFARSGVDGYALRSTDLTASPMRLRIAGEIPAGVFPDFVLEPQCAARIMTGAPVPTGADAVQMVEQTRAEGDHVWIDVPVASGANIAPLGSEVRKGNTVLRAGTRVDPPAIAVAASFGATELLVGRRPRIAVVATGDELVEPGKRPGPGQIRNSNGYSVVAQCQAVGCDAEFLGVAADNKESLRELFDRGFLSDILLISGGVSMGRYDLVESVLEDVGVQFAFDSVALKPGKPLVFGTGGANDTGSNTNGKLVFGLPGNPVSTMVTFELFVRPAIARMEGIAHPKRPLVRAKLSAELKSRGARRAFLPGWISRLSGSNDLLAEPISTRGSGDIVAFSKANALLIVPEDVDALAPNDFIHCYPLDSFLNHTERWTGGQKGQKDKEGS